MIRKSIDYDVLNLLIDAFEDEEFMIPLRVSGDSMSPLFLSDHTIVHLGHPGTIKKGEVVLFRNAENRFILHRVIKMNRKTKQVITRGDHNIRCDEPILKEDIKAKVVGFYHKDKYYKLNSFYARMKHQKSKVRRLLIRLYSWIDR
ncbi:MAG TPA: signal peptidase I [Bacilli bacterium]|nr:signal peptidase I [Bacilli bacterium]